MGKAAKLNCDFHQKFCLFRLAYDFHYEPVFSLTFEFTALCEGNQITPRHKGETVDDIFRWITVGNRPMKHGDYRVQSSFGQIALRGYHRLWEHHLPKPVKVVEQDIFHIELLADILIPTAWRMPTEQE